MGKVLRVFDFDDTLAKSVSYIYVTHSDGTESTLDPGEYAVYEPKPGDKFDFRDFNRMLNKPKIIKKEKVVESEPVKAPEPTKAKAVKSKEAEPVKEAEPKRTRLVKGSDEAKAWAKMMREKRDLAKASKVVEEPKV